MPILILLGGVALISLLISREQKVTTKLVQLGATPVRPPVAYVGDEVFSLPQERWGTIECITRGGNGYCYGVRLGNGLAVVRRDHELVR